MTHDHPPVLIPATSDYVLDVFRDSYRQQCQFDPEAEPHVELTFDTTVAEWRSACDLLEWRRLGRGLDFTWGMGCSDAAWQAVLEPEDERTLGDVCEFIARSASRPSIEPVKLLGATCLPAGAFLAIRTILGDAGADVDGLTPSTLLCEYTRRHLDAFLGPISRLAPNALPAVTISTPWHELVSAGLLLGVVITLIGWLVFPPATAAGILLALGSWAASWITARRVPPSKVEFGSLRTFRDLARVVAQGAQAEGRP